ncbi:hypothetical protein [uncultured Alistipes sp.]|uniref:hypothetical protein n=1 Tax=uncultured Alistipes sp. TaxID=538949 RepID=UPI00266B41EC|nr:hypothetical protein [uncultured Alistipes sp.]
MKTRNKLYDKSRLRILCLLAALLGIFGAGQTWAANDPTTLVVGGTSVVANGTVSETTSGEGWSYADGTLTLNNATITGTSSTDYGAAIYAAGDLTIELEGSSNAKGAVHSSDMPFSGLYVSGTLTISGEGSLTVNAVESTNSSKNNYGIYADTYIQNGGSINSQSGTGAASRGVYAYGMTVNGGSLTATGGGTYDSSGIYVTGTITVGSATVNATGNSYGIYSYLGGGTNSLTVTGGTVTATGNSSAIYIETMVSSGGSANNHVSVTVSNSGSITAQGGAGIVLKSSQFAGGTGTGSMTVESGSTLLANSVTLNDSPLTLTGEGSWLIYGQSDQTSAVGGNYTLTKDVTIPSGVTVTVPEGSSLTIPNGKTLTVTDAASQLVVNGELVLEGTFNNAKELTGTGAIVLGEITLTDDEGIGEYQLKLKSKKVTYTRNTTDGAYGTICLPFVPASVAGGQVTYYKVKELNGNELILGETDFEAGKPLFYQTSGAGSAITFSAENAEGVELVTEPATDSFMVGTMSEETPTTGYFLKNDNIYPITDGAKVKVKPFRAYVKGQNDASQASVMSVNVARP